MERHTRKSSSRGRQGKVDDFLKLSAAAVIPERSEGSVATERRSETPEEAAATPHRPTASDVSQQPFPTRSSSDSATMEPMQSRKFPKLLAALLFAASCATANVEPRVPSNELFARVMPKAFAERFAAGTGRLGGGSEVFITAADDLSDVRTAEDAQKRLALFLDFEATKPNLLGDTIVRFKLRDPSRVNLRVPSPSVLDTAGQSSPRGYGYKAGGRTGGGAREWVIDNGTAAEIGAYEIELLPLQH